MSPVQLRLWREDDLTFVTKHRFAIGFMTTVVGMCRIKWMMCGLSATAAVLFTRARNPTQHPVQSMVIAVMICTLSFNVTLHMLVQFVVLFGNLITWCLFTPETNMHYVLNVFLTLASVAFMTVPHFVTRLLSVMAMFALSAALMTLDASSLRDDSHKRPRD